MGTALAHSASHVAFQQMVHQDSPLVQSQKDGLACYIRSSRLAILIVCVKPMRRWSCYSYAKVMCTSLVARS